MRKHGHLDSSVVALIRGFEMDSTRARGVRYHLGTMATRKTTAKKSAAKKSPAKKATTKKAAGKKGAAKKASSRILLPSG